MCPSPVYSITMSNVPTRDQFRVFLESYKNDVSQRFVGCGRKRLIYLGHESSYGVGIENKTNSKCLAEVVIGDVILGVFVLLPRETIIIKRGVKDDRSLVFISNTSDLAAQVGLPRVTGSGEIYVSLRPQHMSVEEYPGGSSSPFRSTMGSGKYGTANQYGAASVTPPMMSGMKVVTDTISESRSAGFDCVDGPTSSIRSAGAPPVKKSTEVHVDGSTILGLPTGQRFQMLPNFSTLGCHLFRFLLQVGDSNRNVHYNGFLDDDGSPFSRCSPYSVLV